jgi:membrane protein DedA with SNARE-associated domain
MLFGLASVFVVILLKEAGIPIPVPTDVIMLGVAARAASGQLNLPAVILTIEIAMVIGGTIQYLAARGPGRRLLYRFGRYVGLTPARLERAARTLQRGGIATVTIALATPGIRAATIAAAGLADLRFATFFPALLIGDSIFFLLHVAIGYAGGRGLGALAHAGHPTWPVLLIALVILALVGLAGWLVLRRRTPGADAPKGRAEAIGAWTEAACPACLALAALYERHSEVQPATA